MIEEFIAWSLAIFFSIMFIGTILIFVTIFIRGFAVAWSQPSVGAKRFINNDDEQKDFEREEKENEENEDLIGEELWEIEE